MLHFYLSTISSVSKAQQIRLSAWINGLDPRPPGEDSIASSLRPVPAAELGCAHNISVFWLYSEMLRDSSLLIHPPSIC